MKPRATAHISEPPERGANAHVDHLGPEAQSSILWREAAQQLAVVGDRDQPVARSLRSDRGDSTLDTRRARNASRYKGGTTAGLVGQQDDSHIAAAQGLECEEHDTVDPCGGAAFQRIEIQAQGEGAVTRDLGQELENELRRVAPRIYRETGRRNLDRHLQRRRSSSLAVHAQVNLPVNR